MGKRNIYQKLCYIQAKLKAPKNQYNKFGNYYYRNSEDIQEALKPLMKRVGAALIINDEVVQVGERFYIKATARFIDTETGETIKNTAFAREEAERKGMDAAQITGSTSSYARKYALNGLFCIDDTKDADALQGQHSGAKEPQKGQQREQNGKNERKEKTASILSPTSSVQVAPSSPTPAATKPEPSALTPTPATKPEPSALTPTPATKPTPPTPVPAIKESSPILPFPGLEAKYVNTLYLELSRTGVGLKGMLAKYKKKDIHELTLDDYKNAMDILAKKPDKKVNDVSTYFPPDNLDETGLPWAAAAT